MKKVKEMLEFIGCFDVLFNFTCTAGIITAFAIVVYNALGG